jgi:hypothetical protein
VNALRIESLGFEVVFYTRYCMQTSENSSSETVWKIAGGLSTTHLWQHKVAERGSFDPSWRLSVPLSGTHPDFPNSFSTHSGE